MYKKLVCFISLFFLLAIPSKASSPIPEISPPYSSENIIVRFKKEIDPITFSNLETSYGTKMRRKIFDDKTFVLKVPSKNIEQFVNLLSKNPLVEYAEPDFIAQAYEDPNDSYFNQQWGLKKIQAPEGWNLTHGNPQVKIAILDTGIDRDHPDLSAKVDKWIDMTSSGMDDLFGHGTHVAGIAAAVTNNNQGVAGLGYDVHLVSIKVLGNDGFGYYSWIADGIKKAADEGAKVINLSLGSDKESKTLEQAINYAWSKGAVIVCAAGNAGNSFRTYPAYYTNCIATAATDKNDQKPSWSSYGLWVDVAAPGNEIISTLPNHQYKMGQSLNYGYGSGTSMATPHVSGLAGLLFGSDATLTNNDVRKLIEENTDQISGTGNYWQKGRINVSKSILGLGSGSLISTPIPTVTPTPTFIPIPTVTPTPTLTPTPTPQPTLTPTPRPTKTPTPTPSSQKSRLCERWPRFCN